MFLQRKVYKGGEKMLKIMFLVFTLSILGGMAGYAEEWQLVGSPESRFQKLIDEFYRKLSVGDKDDVINALRDNNYEVYVDKDSIKESRVWMEEERQN